MSQMDASSLPLKYVFTLTLLGVCVGQISFTSQPSDLVVPPNTPLQIPCTATTNLPGVLHILWRRNHTWIVDYKSKHYRQLANGSLQFEQFLSADQGLYQCSALVVDSNHVHLGQVYSRNATIKIAYIEASFFVNPEARSAQIGSNIQLQCLSPRSEPIAQVDWEKNNIKLSGYENGSVTLLSEKRLSSTILLKNLSNSDAGTYQCVAYNKLLPGKAVRSLGASVTIAARQSQPYFEKRPTSVVASRHQPFIWECRIRGVPEPVIQWYHNGRNVTFDQNRMKLASGSLHFVSVLEQYNGSYVCEGSNTLGKISSQPVAFVVAFIDFDFVTDPATTTITHGNTLLLRCVPPRSYPIAVTITWYVNYTRVVPGGAISITADNSLRITSITRSSEGVYFCQAYNAVTKESRSSRAATVSVRVTPRVQISLTNTSAVVGDSVVLNCSAMGHPAPSLKWMKDNVVISNTGNTVLPAVSLNDSGYYSCVATNSAGNDSKRFYLQVSSKPVANVLPSNKTKIVGQPAEFNCDFAGTPKPVTSWYFIARGSSVRLRLAFGSRISKTSSGIRISSVLKSDEGRYICTGNSSGGSQEVYAFLTVQVPPEFLIRPRNQTAVVSSRFTMQCVASGDPAPMIVWMFGSSILSNGAKYRIVANSLTVNNVAVGDKGWYTCRIVNIAGNKSAMAYVDVHVSPSITEFFVPQRVRAGDRFTIICKGTGNPKPLVTWRRNSTSYLQIDGSRISGNETNIVIAQARSSDSGVYECILANLLDRAARNSSLIVQVLPHPPRNLIARAVLSTAIEIQWAAGFNGFSTILSYDLEMLRQGTVQWRAIQPNIPGHMVNYTVRGLVPFTMYGFRMRTQNEVGKSVYSVIASARTLEDAPSIPLNFHVSIINTTSATLKWSPPATPNGNITTYQLVYGAVGSLQPKEATIRDERKASYEMEIKPLKPFTMYFAKIRAATLSSNMSNWGNYSNVIYFKTLETVPSIAPTIQNVTSQNSTSIMVSFSMIPAGLINGIFTGYVVTVEMGTDKRTVNTNETRITVAYLRKATTYSVYVRACNRAGCGPSTKSISVSTLEDVPGIVSNATAIALSPTSILIKWLEPLEPNGVITGYTIFIRNTSNFYFENITLPGSTLELRKDGLRSNTTYFVTIAAKTKIGMGEKVPEIAVKLSNIDAPITPSASTETTKLFSAVSTATTATTPATTTTTTTNKSVIQSGSQTSVDWLHEKNLPILIGVSVAIFILLIVVIVLIAWTFSRRIKSGTVKRQRWLSTRTYSGAENPAYNPNSELELAKQKSEQSHSPEIIVDDADEKHDDFVFESDSEPSQIINSVNPSNQYASDDTMRFKDDTSPLVELRDTEVELSDGASDYDKPYSSLDEVMDPIPDMFGFIDEEDRKSEKTTLDTPSSNEPSDSGCNQNVAIPEAGHLELQHADSEPNRRSPNPADLTWDNYDTSRAVIHDPNEHEYAVPSVEDPASDDHSVAGNNKRQDIDQAYLIDNEETII